MYNYIGPKYNSHWGRKAVKISYGLNPLFSIFKINRLFCVCETPNGK